MSDDIDRAQDLDAQDRERALAAARQRVADSFAPRQGAIEGLCIDCGDPIEPARLAVLSGKTCRCASCAHDHEQRSRGFR